MRGGEEYENCIQDVLEELDGIPEHMNFSSLKSFMIEEADCEG